MISKKPVHQSKIGLAEVRNVKELLMSHFDVYRDSFPNARLTRSKTGVLEVALHTNGGTLAFNGYTHEQFVELFHAIGSDPDNRVVILTGSGKAFMESISPEGFDFFSPVGYDKIYREGRKVLMNILDIEVPLIAAVNGPVRLHSEYILLADIVLATPSTVFQDKPHFELGVASGDGVHLLWQEAIGSIRGRYFIMTRQELDAQTAKDWGAVNEIVPADKLLARAREIAEGLAKLPPLTRNCGASSMRASDTDWHWRVSARPKWRGRSEQDVATMALLVTSAAGTNGDGYGALLAFDSDGKSLGAFSDDSRIADPRGLAVDPSEGLLFLNSGNDRVLALNSDGTVVRDTGQINGLNPGGGIFGPDGR